MVVRNVVHCARYLGLLMNIILFIMFVLSCLLIYSLLLINVGSRAFELAIRRMLGSTRPVLVLLLAFQVRFSPRHRLCWGGYADTHRCPRRCLIPCPLGCLVYSLLKASRVR